MASSTTTGDYAARHGASPQYHGADHAADRNSHAPGKVEPKLKEFAGHSRLAGQPLLLLNGCTHCLGKAAGSK